MNTCINFFAKHSGKILVITSLATLLLILFAAGFIPAAIYASFLVVLFFSYIFYRVYPKKGRLVFYNRGGAYTVYDIVYDRGSATRPAVPGILKYDKEAGWFVVYDDGFEWPLSDFRNVELFIYQSNKK